MKKGENYNHPKKGSHLTVEPIRKVKDIKLIKKLLSDKPLDLVLCAKTYVPLFKNLC